MAAFLRTLREALNRERSPETHPYAERETERDRRWKGKGKGKEVVEEEEEDEDEWVLVDWDDETGVLTDVVIGVDAVEDMEEGDELVEHLGGKRRKRGRRALEERQHDDDDNELPFSVDLLSGHGAPVSEYDSDTGTSSVHNLAAEDEREAGRRRWKSEERDLQHSACASFGPDPEYDDRIFRHRKRRKGFTSTTNP